MLNNQTTNKKKSYEYNSKELGSWKGEPRSGNKDTENKKQNNNLSIKYLPLRYEKIAAQFLRKNLVLLKSLRTTEPR